MSCVQPLPSPPLLPLLRCLDGRFNWDTSAVSETIHTPIGWSLEIQRDFKGKYETKLELSELSGSNQYHGKGRDMFMEECSVCGCGFICFQLENYKLV